MRKTGNPAIKKYFLTVALFFSFSVVLYLGQIFVTKQSEALLKQTANGVLKSWSNTAPEVGNRIKLTTKGLSYTWTFDTISKGNKTGLVFITAITGNSGPYTGIFI